MAGKKFNALPGFRLTMGITLFFLCIIVLIPFAGLSLRVAGVCWKTPGLDAHNTGDLSSLVAELKRHKEPVAALLWDRFSEPLRQKISAASEETEDPAASIPLLAELNGLLRGGSFYD